MVDLLYRNEILHDLEQMILKSIKDIKELKYGGHREKIKVELEILKLIKENEVSKEDGF